MKALTPLSSSSSFSSLSFSLLLSLSLSLLSLSLYLSLSPSLSLSLSLSQLPSDPHLLRATIACVKSVSRALAPCCLVPRSTILSNKYQPSGLNYDPQPVDTTRYCIKIVERALISSTLHPLPPPLTCVVLNYTVLCRVTLSADLLELVEDFAEYQHKQWVFSQQNSGWTYGPFYSKEEQHHPNIRPYQSLAEQVLCNAFDVVTFYQYPRLCFVVVVVVVVVV